MKSKLLIALFILSSISTTAFASSVACIDADKATVVEVTGTIKKVNFQHPNGSLLTAYMLVLDKPVCYSQLDLESGKIQARQDSDIQVTGSTSGLVDGSRVKLSGVLSGNNVTPYYLSDTVISIQ